MNHLPFKLILIILVVACSDKSRIIDKKDYQARLEKANDELLNKGNADFAESLFASDYNNVGPDAIKEFVTNIRTAFPDLEVSVQNRVSDEKSHAWTRTHTGTHKGPFMGFLPINNKITWNSTVISEFNDDGMVSKEWGGGDLHDQLSKFSANGTYKYLPPIDGYAIINSDKFMWSFTNTDVDQQFSEFGTIDFDDGLLIYTIKQSNKPNRVDVSFKTRMIGQFGDTLKWHYINNNNEITGTGLALKMPQ